MAMTPFEFQAAVHRQAWRTALSPITSIPKQGA